jgi:precorrin-6B methylase 2
VKIYTYYEDVGFEKQSDLISQWKKSWKNYGFTPVVLERKDAEKSKFFAEYLEFIQRVHVASVGCELKDSPEDRYWIAAQLEILAFHTVQDLSYFSDYDMINNGFTDITYGSKGNLKWLEGDCPCLSAGDSVGWEKYILFLFDKEKAIIDFLKNRNKETGRTKFGDQDFLEAVFRDGLDKEVFTMMRNRFVAGDKYRYKKKNICGVIHLSHNNCIEITKENKELTDLSTDDLRVELAKQIIHEQKDQILNLNTKEFHNSEIVQSINNEVKPYAPEGFEGNCLYQHTSNFEIDINKEVLRNNIYQLAKYHNNILDIGVNGGHSAALYFFANPNAHVVGIDNCMHPYTKRCCEILSQRYDFSLIEGDSKDTLKSVYRIGEGVKFDIIHIDGGHTTDQVISDIRNCKKFSKVGNIFKSTILILDDVPAEGVKNAIEKLTKEKYIKELWSLYKSDKIQRNPFHRFFVYAK